MHNNGARGVRSIGQSIEELCWCVRNVGIYYHTTV
jgi:hypothetical protein